MKRIPLLLTLLLLCRCGGGGENSADITDARSPETDVMDVIEEWDFGFIDIIDSELMEPVQPTLSLIAPATVLPNRQFPVVLRVTVDDRPAFQLTTGVPITLNGSGAGTLALRRGAGSAEFGATEDDTIVGAEVVGNQTDRLVKVTSSEPARELEGELNGAELSWGPNEVVRIAGDVIIPVDKTLTIESGTTVLLDAKANLLVGGSIVGNGTFESPLFFTEWEEGKPWGGLRIVGGSATFSYAFFAHGGGDGKYVFGHSGSQAVLFVEEGELTMEDTFILDNSGKGLGAQLASLTAADSLISRCDTGGELKQTQAEFYRTWFLEMPSADGEPDDDDNDGIYLHNPPPDLPADEASATVTECVFAVGKDDAIDHNGSRIRVTDSFIEGFHHEGVACSKNNWVEIRNTLVRDCQQGIESGYGSPQVTVDHCTVVENEVGFRLGDSYERVVSGTLTVTNSIAALNSDSNVWNFSRRDSGPLPENVSISNSIVDSPEWDDINDNIPGLPEFDSTWHLLPNSVGIGASSDGLDVGLL
jgi:hypothetical protein